MIHLGDAVEQMRRMPNEYFGCIVTSPPYNLRNSTGGGFKGKPAGKWKANELRKGYASHADNLPHDEYVLWQRECLAEMMRVLRPDGAIFYNHKWRVQGGLLQDRADIVKDFPVRQIIIWHRRGGMNHNPGYFLPTYEVIYLICKKDFKLVKGANGAGDVWRIDQEANTSHPAPFPLELAERCIAATDPRYPVLDPFLGSGTVGVAAEKLGRSWAGIEKSVEYCKLAGQRLERECGKRGVVNS